MQQLRDILKRYNRGIAREQQVALAGKGVTKRSLQDKIKELGLMERSDDQLYLVWATNYELEKVVRKVFSEKQLAIEYMKKKEYPSLECTKLNANGIFLDQSFGDKMGCLVLPVTTTEPSFTGYLLSINEDGGGYHNYTSYLLFNNEQEVIESAAEYFEVEHDRPELADHRRCEVCQRTGDDSECRKQFIDELISDGSAAISCSTSEINLEYTVIEKKIIRS